MTVDWVRCSTAAESEKYEGAKGLCMFACPSDRLLKIFVGGEDFFILGVDWFVDFCSAPQGQRPEAFAQGHLAQPSESRCHGGF